MSILELYILIGVLLSLPLLGLFGLYCILNKYCVITPPRQKVYCVYSHEENKKRGRESCQVLEIGGQKGSLSGQETYQKDTTSWIKF